MASHITKSHHLPGIKRLALSIILALVFVAGIITIIARGAPGAAMLYPPPNSITATLGTFVAIVYDEPISPTTITSRTFAVHGMQSGLVTGAHGTLEDAILVTPTRPFFPGELVQASATTGTLGMDGTAPLTPTVWQFRTAVQTGTGQFPYSVILPFSGTTYFGLALGDLDLDGDLDLAVGNINEPNQIFINDGFGYPYDTTSYTFGTLTDTTSSLAMADVDNDGLLDLIAGNIDEPNAVYINDGDGNPFDTLSHTVGITAESTFGLAVGDFDGDGALDLLVGNEGGENQIYFNDGSGNPFDSWGGALPADDSTYAVAFADVDTDRDLDLVIGNAGPNRIYLNPTFSDPADPFSYTWGIGIDLTYAVSVGDINEDGQADLVSVDGDGHNVVYLNDGIGNPYDSISYTFGISDAWTIGLSLGDLNGDGQLDAVTSQEDGPHLVFINDGIGNPFDTLVHPLGWSGLGVGLVNGDVDGDGDLDLVAANGVGYNIIYFNGIVNSTMYPPPNSINATLDTFVTIAYDEPISPTTVTSRTFAVHGMQSGLVTATHGAIDGTMFVTPTRPFFPGELVQASATTRTLSVSGTAPLAPTVWQFRTAVQGGTGQFPLSLTLPFSAETYFGLALGDIDLDGDLDLAVGNMSQPNILYLNDGLGHPYDTISYTFGTLTDTTISLAMADVDNDGLLDLIAANFDYPSTVYLNDGSGNPFDTVEPYTVGFDPESAFCLAVGDYNGDGALDLLTGSDGPNRLYINDGVGSPFDSWVGVLPADDYTYAVAFADADTDGDLDLVVGNLGPNYIYLNPNVSPPVEPSSLTWGSGTDETFAVAVGDLNQDGQADLVSVGANYPNTIYLNDGSGNPYDTISYTFGSSGTWTTGITLGDLDGDGDLDAVTSHYTGSHEVYINDGIGNPFDTFTHTLGWSGFGVGLVNGDLDGDGDLDLVAANAAGDNAIYINYSAADLAIAKTAHPTATAAGMPITYTITISNAGPSTASDIVLSDTLHPSVTLQYIDQTDSYMGDFDAGWYDNTEWYDSRPGDYDDEWLRIEDTSLITGSFTSRVIDARNVVTWTTLAWEPRRPTWKPLPDNQEAEQYYDLGNADMLGNRALLHLDEASGTVFADTSGMDHHATCPAVAGETCPTPGAAGRFNSALAFDGALSQTLILSDTYNPEQFAVEMWVYPTTVTDTSFILHTDSPTAALTIYSHRLGIVDGHFNYAVNDGVWRQVSGSTLVMPNTWYHVAATAVSDGEIRLYVNGVEEARRNIGPLWQGGEWYRLGSAYGPGSSYYSGRIDEVAIYSRTLSVGEVNDRYLRGALRIRFQVRSCSNPGCGSVDFVGPDGTGDSYFSEQAFTNVSWPGYPVLDLGSSVPSNRYFQYRVTLESDELDYSPELRWVRVGPSHHAVIPSQGDCDTWPNDFTCDLGSLPPGELITVTVHATSHPSALGVVTNTVSVTSTTPGDNPIDNSAFATTTLSSEVYLSIYKYDGDFDADGDLRWGHPHGASDPVAPGEPLVYVLEIHNGGPSTAWNVEINDTLPIEVTDVFAENGWATCGNFGNTITCTADSLAAYSWQHIVVEGLAPDTPGTITNTAWVTALASYVYPSSHISDTESTTIEPLADLEIIKTASPDPVDPFHSITFAITVTNNGPSPATNIEVVDFLEEGLPATPIDGDFNCGAASGGVFTCTLAFLDSGSSASFWVTTTAPITGFVTNRAIVSAETTDTDENNNEAFAFATVRPVADLHIVKDDVLDPVNAGGPLTYTIIVSNTGPLPVGMFTNTLSFSNTKDIVIRSYGRAAGYPSNLHVGGIVGVIADMTVQLDGFGHDYPSDVSILLVGPEGQSVVLMSSVGGDVPVSGLDLTFSDAGSSMPINGPLTSGIYRPSNYGLSRDFYVPAPEGPYGGSLSDLDGFSPNGLWRLYVMDTAPSLGGEITGGWSMHYTITTEDVITVTDALPAGLAGVGTAPPAGWACTTITQSVSCVSSYLPINDPAMIMIWATAPYTPGVITNTAWITSTTADFWPEFNQSTITTTVNAVADLSITKLVTPTAFVGAGSPLTFTLVVSNSGPSAAGGILVTDTLPAGLTGVSAPGCDISALPEVSCLLDSLGAFTTTTFVINATAPITPGVITNTAGVTMTGHDFYLLNNADTVTVTVLDQANLEIVKTGPATSQIGNDLHYTIAVTNLGPSPTSHITMTDIISGGPSFLAYASTFDPGWGCSYNLGQATCVFSGTLAPGVSTNLYLAASAPSVTGTITNTAWVTSSVVDYQPQNNVSTLYTTITDWSILYLPLIVQNYQAGPDLVVDAVIASSDVITVVISNQGDMPVTDEFANEFWVDAYVDPFAPPTAVNQTWAHQGSQGAVWGVVVAGLPMWPGEVVTLTTRATDPRFYPGLSEISWPLAPGTEIWAQVDSANELTTYGAVLESHEIIGLPYNNITPAPFVVTRQKPIAHPPNVEPGF